MNGLPTSLRLGQPMGRNLSYSPYPSSALEEILGGITGLAGTAEDIRKQRRQKALMDAIMSGQEIPATGGPEPAQSTLGRILQTIIAPFNPMGPPTGPVPLEETIAETMLKIKLEGPKEWKPRTKEEALEFEKAKKEKEKDLSYKEELFKDMVDKGLITDEQKLKYMGAYITKTEKGEKETAPSWGQEQQVAGVRNDLMRGAGIVQSLAGEPNPYPIDSLDKAMDYISIKKLDPTLFSAELKQYEPVVVKDKKGKLYHIPRRELQEALKLGYQEVK